MDNLNGTFDILWRGRWLVAAGLILGVLGATVATKTANKVYEATGIIQVDSDLPTGSGEVLGLQQASQGLAATYARLVTARSFMARIKSQVAGGRYTTGQLVQNVSASVVSQSTQSTNLIQLTATAGSPTAATQLATDVARAFVTTVGSDNTSRAEQQQTQLQARITALTKQIDALNPDAGSPSAAAREQANSLRTARSALTTELAAAIARAAGQEGSVTVVAPPTSSGSPVKPRPLLNLLVGIALGLLAGVGLAWLRNALDRELRSADDVQPLIDVPVLASIPLRRGVDIDDLVTREAYDVLRTNLTFVSLDTPVSVITVTSYEAGEGKTATAEGLAHAAARRDLRVLLVDGDLRTAALSARLGAGERAGLTNAMIVSRENDVDPDLFPVAPSLWLLAAGPSPPNPPSLLANVRMTRLVRRLRDRFDLIVIDSPPIGHLADAALLSALSDASLIVARAGKTNRDDLVTAANALKRTPTPLIGAVVFEPRSLDSAYYPTGGSAAARRPRAEVLPLPSAERSEKAL